MIFIKDFDLMLNAKEARETSNCLRRHIGVAIPTRDEETIWGANKSGLACTKCHRETCSAVHAEVEALIRALKHQKEIDIKKLYIWAEVPCQHCLSFISSYSSIDLGYCLLPSSYATEYPAILQRTEEIRQRKNYAHTLGITIVELDREEVIEYELSKHSQTHVQ